MDKYQIMIAAIAAYVAEQNIENHEQLEAAEQAESPLSTYGKNEETVEAYLQQRSLVDAVVAELKK